MIRIGSAGRRAVIALYLTPEEAEDLADMYGVGDYAFRELYEAALRARVLLGEPEKESN